MNTLVTDVDLILVNFSVFKGECSHAKVMIPH